MNRIIVLLAGCLLTSAAGANQIISPLSANNAEKYFNVQDVVVTEMEDTEINDHITGILMDDCSSANEAKVFGAGEALIDKVVIDQIINYGQKIWEVIEANKPVVNINEMTANALPQGESCWTGLSNWELPNSTAYKVTYKNGFGMEVVTFKYRLFYTYGGQVEGQGAYLANVSITPMSIDVAWGFEFNASVDVEKVVNIGPLKDPIAGMELAIKWKVDTPFKVSGQQVKYFVTGDGRDKEYN